ncbi:MAG: 50S ribosomal protein L3 [Chlamydiae bacterium]|nr:50S ribosomal protein L3 [Chlamydiota bacterium]
MSLKLIGKKQGMTQFIDKNGNVIACTVILAEPNVVTQVKSSDKEGYAALQIGAFKAKKLSKPLKGHFEKNKIGPFKHLVETKVEDEKSYSVGQEFKADYFAVGEYVDVQGTSKGKGYQGVMKLHGFKGGPASHGSGFHRHAGSTGMRTTPGRCLPLSPRPSHMGTDTVTVQNLKVIDIDLEKNLIIIEGAVPGCENGLVYLKRSKKMMRKKA